MILICGLLPYNLKYTPALDREGGGARPILPHHYKVHLKPEDLPGQHGESEQRHRYCYDESFMACSRSLKAVEEVAAYLSFHTTTYLLEVSRGHDGRRGPFTRQWTRAEIESFKRNWKLPRDVPEAHRQMLVCFFIRNPELVKLAPHVFQALVPKAILPVQDVSPRRLMSYASPSTHHSPYAYPCLCCMTRG